MRSVLTTLMLMTLLAPHNSIGIEHALGNLNSQLESLAQLNNPSQQEVDKELQYLKSLLQRGEKTLSGTEQQVAHWLRTDLEEKITEMSVAVVATILKDIRGRLNLPLNNPEMRDLRTTMATLFRTGFRDNQEQGCSEALDLVIYKWITIPTVSPLKTPEFVAFARQRLEKLQADWKAIIDPKGQKATYWQIYILEQLHQDKSLSKNFKDAIENMLKAYSALPKALKDASSFAEDVVPKKISSKDVQKIVQSMTEGIDGLVLKYSITYADLAEQITKQFGTTLKHDQKIIKFCISNDGKFYFIIGPPKAHQTFPGTTHEFFDPSTVSTRQGTALFCLDATTKALRRIEGLPREFEIVERSFIIKDTSKEAREASHTPLLRLDTETGTIVPVNFALASVVSLVATNTTGSMLLLEHDGRIEIRNNQLGTTYNLRDETLQVKSLEPIMFAISGDGTTILGLYAPLTRGLRARPYLMRTATQDFAYVSRFNGANGQIVVDGGGERIHHGRDIIALSHDGQTFALLLKDNNSNYEIDLRRYDPLGKGLDAEIVNRSSLIAYFGLPSPPYDVTLCGDGQIVVIHSSLTGTVRLAKGPLFSLKYGSGGSLVESTNGSWYGCSLASQFDIYRLSGIHELERIIKLFNSAGDNLPILSDSDIKQLRNLTLKPNTVLPDKWLRAINMRA